MPRRFDEGKEAVNMVTYEALFAFVIMIIAVIDIVIEINNNKK